MTPTHCTWNGPCSRRSSLISRFFASFHPTRTLRVSSPRQTPRRSSPSTPRIGAARIPCHPAILDPILDPIPTSPNSRTPASQLVTHTSICLDKKHLLLSPAAHHGLLLSRSWPGATHRPEIRALARCDRFLPSPPFHTSCSPRDPRRGRRGASRPCQPATRPAPPTSRARDPAVRTRSPATTSPP